MAITIVERGTPNADKLYTPRCRHCSTVFSFNRSDARFVDDQRDGPALAIGCPVCSEEIWVKA